MDESPGSRRRKSLKLPPPSEPQTPKRVCRAFMPEAVEILKETARSAKSDIARIKAVELAAKIAQVERQDLGIQEYEIITLSIEDLIEKHGHAKIG